jgi:hypothetical protein
METLIPIVIGLIQQSLPFIAGKAPAIASAISIITAVTPTVVTTYKALKPIVGRIIATLKADPSTLPDQLAQLQAAEVLLDADFDAAAAAALVEDEAAG